MHMHQGNPPSVSQVTPITELADYRKVSRAYVHGTVTQQEIVLKHLPNGFTAPAKDM